MLGNQKMFSYDLARLSVDVKKCQRIHSIFEYIIIFVWFLWYVYRQMARGMSSFGQVSLNRFYNIERKDDSQKDEFDHVLYKIGCVFFH